MNIGPRDLAHPLYLVIRDSQALTERQRYPLMGEFRILMDPRKATPAATDRFKCAFAQRKSMSVASHHCGGRVKYMINVRQLYVLNKAPFFDPPSSGQTGHVKGAQNKLDAIIRTFHNSQLVPLHRCKLRSDVGHGKSADYYAKIRAI